MHASYQIINQVAYINFKTHINASKHMNMHTYKCKQAHEYAHIKCKKPSSWACSPYLCAPLVHCPRILILLNISPSWSMSCPCLHSYLPYIFVQTFYIFVQISPPLSSMTIKGPTPYEVCSMWRLMTTTWRLYHENLLWLDAKS